PNALARAGAALLTQGRPRTGTVRSRRTSPMIAPAASATIASPLEDLCARFQEAMPRIERHARIYFRHVVCPNRRADYIAETVAVAWQWFAGLAERGKDASTFVSALATLAARAVRSGHRICGSEKSQDVLSPAAQNR